MWRAKSRGARVGYRTFASSSANTLLPAGEWRRALPDLRSLADEEAGALKWGRLVRSPDGADLATAWPLPLGGCAGLARKSRSSRGARSNRRMMDPISSWFGASMKANPLDSCVSGLRITLTASATKLSAASHDLISSAVTQTGRFPRNTVKLIRYSYQLRIGEGIFEAMPRRRFSSEAINNDSTTTRRWQTAFLSKTAEKPGLSRSFCLPPRPRLSHHGEMPIRPRTKQNHAALSTILSGHSSCRKNSTRAITPRKLRPQPTTASRSAFRS